MIFPDTPEYRKHFDTASNKNTQCTMTGISIFHDILNRITIDALIRPALLALFESSFKSNFISGLALHSGLEAPLVKEKPH